MPDLRLARRDGRACANPAGGRVRGVVLVLPPFDQPCKKIRSRATSLRFLCVRRTFERNLLEGDRVDEVGNAQKTFAQRIFLGPGTGWLSDRGFFT
jgi:hypothetical protein